MNTQTDDAVIETNIDDEGGTETLDRGDDFTPETDEGAPAAPVEDEAAAQAARMIPKSRFDEVNNAKKTAEQENARLLAELEALRTGAAPAAPAAPVEPEVPANEALADLEDQYTDALMDGDKDKAREVRMKINAIVSTDARAQAVQEIENRNSQVEFEQSIDEAVSTVIGQYPQFDDSGDLADPDAIETMVAMRNHYITDKGMSAAQAIVAAANKVATMFAFGTPKAEETTGVDPRTLAAMQRGAAVAAAQPSTSAVGVGTRQDAPRANISTMSEDEFDALPDPEKRRMRGD